MSEPPNVSVVIPTRNGGVTLEMLLTMLRMQEGAGTVETIIVDSGSSDQTVAAAAAHGTRIIPIDPTDFAHDHARNLGAEQAAGTWILFTVQDPFPPSNTWLAELIHALKAKDNVACLIGRDLFLNYRFRYPYAEDLDLGVCLIHDGHRLALLHTPQIIHGHKRPASYYVRRGYVNEQYLSRIMPSHRFNPSMMPDALCEDLLLSYAVLNGRTDNGNMTVGNGYVDPAFEDFIAALHGANRHRTARYRKRVLGGLLHAMDIVFDYMAGAYRMVDETVWNELAPCFYHAFAFQAGLY